MAGQAPRDPADPYQVLGVPADASREEITRAYRQLARTAHPDTRRDGAGSADRFHRVASAYRILADPAQRASYDRAHPHPRPAGAPLPGPRHLGPPQIWAGPVQVEPPAPRVGPGSSRPGPPPSMDVRWGAGRIDDLVLLIRWLGWPTSHQG